nr:DUF29 domain-containing protein [Azospirillum sp. SYSU D00513]
MDLDNLVEEIEGLGNEQRHAVQTALLRTVEHLLRLQHSLNDEPRRRWRRAVLNQRVELQSRLEMNPSLKQPEHLEDMLADAWTLGRRLARAGLMDEDELDAAETIPVNCPYTVDQILDLDWWPPEPEGKR